MAQLGLGVIIDMLSGNKATVTACRTSIGKEITEIKLADEILAISFTDGTQLRVWDNRQSCCERRYMRTDDDLSFAGAKLLNLEIKSAPNEQHECSEHEVQFLEVQTDKGLFTIASHNEHNGYYGGFSIVAELTCPKS